MAKAHPDWHVLAHGSIEQLADNLWWVQGDLPNMSLKRVMTVARTSDEKLIIHSAIALEEPLMQELLAWGAPAYLLVPNGYHRLDAPAWKRRFPDLKVLAPRGSQAKVSEVVHVDGSYEDFPARDDVRLFTLPGVSEREGGMLVRSADGVSVVLNDVVFNMDRKRDLLGFLFTTILGSAPGPRISRLAKLALVKDSGLLKRELATLADQPDLVRLIVSHEKVARGAEARQALVTALGYL
jgi:hypothetical protein